MNETEETADLKRQLAEAKAKEVAYVNTIESMADDVPHQKARRSNEKSDYVQISRKKLHPLATMARSHATAHFCLMYFASKMSKTNSLIISQKGLSTVMGVSLSSTQRAVKYLVENRWVKVIKVATQNAYVLNANVFWRNSLGAKQKIAVFDATVIAFEDEQDPKSMEKWNTPLQHPTVVNEDYIQQFLDFVPDDPVLSDSTVIEPEEDLFN
jgi:hypothetical protein